jgi:hypothetical protein
MSYSNKSLIEQTIETDNPNKSFVDFQDGFNMKKGTKNEATWTKKIDDQTMTEKINQINRGLISDINLVPDRKYDSLNNQNDWNKYTAKDSVLFNNIEESALKGISEESTLSKYFFSDMNIEAINKIIRYRIFKELNKVISNQSMTELSVIMRSIFLKNINKSNSKSHEILPNIKKLNGFVVDYSIKNIKINIQQYDGYIDKLNSLPEPLDLPMQGSNKNYTYDISNLL